MEGKFKLFSNCIPVKGANRAVICDLQRTKLNVIPNDLYTILTEHEDLTISEVKRVYKNEYDSTIDEYFDFLLKLEYIFLTDSPDLFPKLDTQFHYPFEISNSIIDLSYISNYDLITVFDQLDELNCKHIQVRFFEIAPIILFKALEFLQNKNSIIHSIDIVTHQKHNSLEFWKDKLNSFPRLNTILIYGCEKKELDQILSVNNGQIIFTSKVIDSETHCGVISVNNFAVNIKNFTESWKYNSCLNRKISIDVEGHIKNCPSMPESFGNIKDTTLQEALEKKDFKKYWNITKDQIDVCKDCEFRYVCTDCRAYTEDPEDDYSKPLKCGYSPYTNVWEEWSKNPLKQKAIEYYGMQDLIKRND